MDRICSSVGNLLQEFLVVQEKESAIPSPPSEQRWCPPTTDGALSIPISLGSSVAELEALACLRAVQFASEIGLTRVVFEGDSAAVINALRQGLGELTCYGNMLDDIRVLVSAFQYCDFNLVKRLCNLVADAIAKKANSVVGSQV